MGVWGNLRSALNIAALIPGPQQAVLAPAAIAANVGNGVNNARKGNDPTTDIFNTVGSAVNYNNTRGGGGPDFSSSGTSKGGIPIPDFMSDNNKLAGGGGFKLPGLPGLGGGGGDGKKGSSSLEKLLGLNMAIQGLGGLFQDGEDPRGKKFYDDTIRRILEEGDGSDNEILSSLRDTLGLQRKALEEALKGISKPTNRFTPFARKGSPENPIQAANGFRGTTTQPTTFQTSENGQPEYVDIQPGGQTKGQYFDQNQGVQTNNGLNSALGLLGIEDTTSEGTGSITDQIDYSNPVSPDLAAQLTYTGPGGPDQDSLQALIGDSQIGGVGQDKIDGVTPGGTPADYGLVDVYGTNERGEPTAGSGGQGGALGTRDQLPDGSTPNPILPPPGDTGTGDQGGDSDVRDIDPAFDFLKFAESLGLQDLDQFGLENAQGRLASDINQSSAARGAFGGSANQRQLSEGFADKRIDFERLKNQANQQNFTNALGLSSQFAGLQGQEFGQAGSIFDRNSGEDQRKFQNIMQSLGMSSDQFAQFLNSRRG